VTQKGTHQASIPISRFTCVIWFWF